MNLLPSSFMDPFILYPPCSGKFEIWQLVTHMFLHASISHVFFNMLLLWQFGNIVERQFKNYFKNENLYLYAYIAFGALSGAIYLIFNHFTSQSNSGSIGASGAIFSILTLYCLINPEDRILLFFIIPMKSKWLLYISIVVEIFGAISTPNDNIGHIAHLGGILLGFLFWKKSLDSLQYN